MKKYKTFKEFYPYYLEEHKHKHTKLLHFIGSNIALYFVLNFFASFQFIFLLYALLSGYSMAWASHFFIEKNRPATFKYPLYSLVSDYVMWFETLKGKHKIL